MNHTQRLESIQKELTEALAQKALLDEKIVALRNLVQGISFGAEMAKAAAAAPQSTEQ